MAKTTRVAMEAPLTEVAREARASDGTMECPPAVVMAVPLQSPPPRLVSVQTQTKPEDDVTKLGKTLDEMRVGIARLRYHLDVIKEAVDSWKQ